jgi:hypothetical protein
MRHLEMRNLSKARPCDLEASGNKIDDSVLRSRVLKYFFNCSLKVVVIGLWSG